MSELTKNEIIKKTNSILEIKIISFRDDALPNPELKNAKYLEIATTGLVMFANFVGYSGGEFKETQQFYNKLIQIEGEVEHTKFKESTVNFFIKNAQVVSYYNNEGCEWINELPFEINNEQRESLYKLQINHYKNSSMDDELSEFLEEHPSIESNFNLDVLYFDSDELINIIGKINTKKIETHITITLEFNDESYISLIKESEIYSFDTSLDSYLYGWL